MELGHGDGVRYKDVFIRHKCEACMRSAHVSAIEECQSSGHDLALAGWMSLKASRLLQVPTPSTQVGRADGIEHLDLQMTVLTPLFVLVRPHQITFHSRPNISQRILRNLHTSREGGAGGLPCKALLES